jgi:hypothetical protein
MPVFEMPLQQISVSPLDWVKENTNSSTQNQDWKVQVCNKDLTVKSRNCTATCHY